MIDFLDTGAFGNPSASHHLVGQEASRHVENSRQKIAGALGLKPHQIIFTSGATEANNLVLSGFYARHRTRGLRIFYGSTEHKSVLESAVYLGSLPGCTSSEIPVHPDGTVNLAKLQSMLEENPTNTPTLVALMHCNNEIPARHPIEDIGKLCIKYGAYFHCDAVQGFVREPLNFRDIPLGSAVISAHKIYGPKGLGILCFSSHPTAPRILPPYRGGEQEQGLRPGTLNTLAIVGGAVAVETHQLKRAELLPHLNACDSAFTEIMSHDKRFHLTVPMNSNCPGIINFWIDGCEASSLLEKIPHICINRGASCLGGGGEHYSHVPKALGLPIEVQANVLRASFGFDCTVDDVVSGAKAILVAISTLP